MRLGAGQPLPQGPLSHGRAGRVRVLSEAERLRLLVACQTSRTPASYPLVLLALTTAARKNELRWLRWRDVHLERGTLTCVRTKNGDTRTVPVVGVALQVLRQWHVRERIPECDREPDALVFPRPDSKGPVCLLCAWPAAVRRAGITDFHFHDLRHCAASYLAMSGASIVELAEILGHKQLNMVKRYTHLSPHHTAQVLTRMTEQFPLTLPEHEGGSHDRA